MSKKDDYMELDKKYFEMFGDYFPSMELGTDEEKVQACIDNNMDAYKMFDLKDDVLY